MIRPRLDFAWSLLSLAIAEVLNPLLLISSALFVSVGYILTLLMPVSIDMWAALLLLCIALPLAFLTVGARRLWLQDKAGDERFSWRCFLPILPILLFLPPALAKLLMPSIYIIPHTDLQFPFIMQVFLGTSPYDSVIAPGNPSNQYWLYFVFVAAVIRVSSLDIFSAWVIVNMAFFFSSSLWIGRTLLLLNLARSRTLCFGLLTLFCFAAANLTDIMLVAAQMFSDIAPPPDDSFLFALDRAAGRMNRMEKLVASARGLSAGITAFTAVTFVAVKFLRGEFDRTSLALLSASGVVSLAFMPILAFYICVSVLGALALTALYMLATKPDKKWLAKYSGRIVAAKAGPPFVLFWFVASLILALSALAYVLDFSSGHRSALAVVLFHTRNFEMLMATSLLLLPLAGAQMVQAGRSGRATDLFFAFSAIIGLGLALTLTPVENTLYKFHYPLTTQLAILALLFVRRRSTLRGFIASAIKVYGYALVILALMNVATYSYQATRSRFGAPIHGHYDGIRVYSVDDFGGRLSAYYWIRDHSPHDAIVLAPHTYTAKSKLFHGRLNYVSKGGKTYSDYLPGYDQRLTDLHTFYNPKTTKEEYLGLLASMQTQLPGRPLYAVVMDPEVSREIMAGRGAQLVFEKPPYGAHVYLLNPPAAG